MLTGTDRQAVWDFYVRKLGYRPVRRTGPEPEKEDTLLLCLGQSRIEVRCTAGNSPLPEQELRLRSAGLPDVRARLLESGIDPGEYKEDPYTGLRELRFTGPDGVRVVITEAE